MKRPAQSPSRLPRLLAAVAPQGSLWVLLVAALSAWAWRGWQPTSDLRPLESTAWLDPATAPVESFRLLPGIGPKLAERIGQARGEGIDFDGVEDLQQVSGIGPRRVEALRPHVKDRAGSAGPDVPRTASEASEVAPTGTRP